MLCNIETHAMGIITNELKLSFDSDPHASVKNCDSCHKSALVVIVLINILAGKTRTW